MQITGYAAIDQTQWPYEQHRRTRSSTESSGSRGDTVNFSDEALELLARSQAVKATAEETTAESAGKDEQEHSAGESSTSRSSTATPVTGSGSASSSGEGFGDTAGEHSEASAKDSAVHEQNKAAQEAPSDEDIDAQIEKIKSEMVQLAQKISQIYAMPLDEQTKQGMAQPYEDRINLLQAQIASLEAKKEAQTEKAGSGEMK